MAALNAEGEPEKWFEKCEGQTGNVDVRVDFPALKEVVLDLLSKYSKVITGPSSVRGTEFKIKLGEEMETRRVAAYSANPNVREQMESQLAELVEEGILIRIDNAPEMSSPIFMIPKKGTTELRLVVDYRYLNSITISLHYEIPKIEHLTSQFEGCKVFSKIDCKSSFYQIPVEASSQLLTTITTPLGHFKFTRMPFGLKNAPMAFQEFIETVITADMKSFTEVYIDDIIVKSKTVEEHGTHLQVVLEALERAGLVIKLSKCEFGKSKVSFLGFEVTEEGVTPGNLGTEKILQLKYPRNKVEVQKLLGSFNFFRHFVPKFSEIALPLTTLTKKEKRFSFGQEEREAVDRLKNILTSEPLLVHPKWGDEFLLVTDASDSGMGAVLMQKHGVIRYWSKSLKEHEKKWAAWERECLAIVGAVEHFSFFLRGQKTVIRTDSSPVAAVGNQIGSTQLGKLSRWVLCLQEYDLVFEHLPGKENGAADLLSRLYENTEFVGATFHPEEVFEVDSDSSESESGRELPGWAEIGFGRKGEEVTLWQREDGDLIEAWTMQGQTPPDNPYAREAKELHLDEFGAICRFGVWVLPKHKAKEVVKLIHTSVPNCHRGQKQTRRAITTYYWALNISEIVKEICENCPHCQLSTTRGGLNLPQQILPSRRLWEELAMDFMGPFAEAQPGKEKYVLLVVDAASRFPFLIPTANKTAPEVAMALLNRVFPFTGVPQILKSDNEATFVGELLKQIMEVLGAAQMHILPENPNANGKAERHVKSAKETVRKLLSPENGKMPETWPSLIPSVEWSIRHAYHGGIGMSPAEYVYGQKIRPGYAPWFGGEFKTLKHQAAEEVRLGRVEMQSLVNEHLHNMRRVGNWNSKMESKKNRDRTFPKAVSPPLKVGDYVRAKDKRSLGFTRPWNGPFRIKEVRWPNLVLLEAHLSPDIKDLWAAPKDLEVWKGELQPTSTKWRQAARQGSRRARGSVKKTLVRHSVEK